MKNENKSIRILSVVPYRIFPALMGGQKGIALFYNYFSTLVPFACFTVQSNQSNESYTVLNQMNDSKTRYFNPLHFFRIKKIATENECTHLLFEHPYYAWMIFLFRHLTSFNIIVHSHNIESERFKSIGKWWWKLLWYYEGMAYRNAHHVWFKTRQDSEYAKLYFKLKHQRCATIPYGIEANKLPETAETMHARAQLMAMYKISAEDHIILFNGTLNYKPNLDALKSILNNINPLLLKQSFHYKILICGKALPAEMNELAAFTASNIIYCGFVDDIDLYFKGCDLFLNPLQDGGGIKTKLVEALGFGKKCVSSSNGALGVDEACTGGRLSIVADKDWNAYSTSIIEMCSKQINNDHAEFYKNYSWQRIAEKAVSALAR